MCLYFGLEISLLIDQRSQHSSRDHTRWKAHIRGHDLEWIGLKPQDLACGQCTESFGPVHGAVGCYWQ